jgi:hypothetical protein
LPMKRFHSIPHSQMTVKKNSEWLKILCVLREFATTSYHLALVNIV